MEIDEKPIIICVDDERHVLSALRRCLCDDFTVITAEGAEKVAGIILANPGVAAVISDHHMPVINGLDLLGWVRFNATHAARIVLSGYPDSTLIDKDVTDGLIHAFIQKPWDDTQLPVRIREIIASVKDSAGRDESSPPELLRYSGRRLKALG